MSSDSVQLDKLNTLLKSNNANYSIFTDNFSIKTASEGAKHYSITLDETTPTLVLKSQETYFAAIICGSTRISFKKLKQTLGIKEIKMADPQTVLTLTGAKVGEVCLINMGLSTLVDKNVLKNKNCYGGCGISNATLKIDTSDLIKITNAQILDFTESR